MFGHEKNSVQNSPTPKENFVPDKEMEKEFKPEEKKKPRPLANPEAMPQNLMKYEKPSPSKKEQKKEKSAPVLISLANPEAMLGPKKVKDEKTAGEIIKEKEEKKEDLFFEIFNRIAENDKSTNSPDSLLGKLEEEEIAADAEKEESQKFLVKKYLASRKKKQDALSDHPSQEILSENNEASSAEEISPPLPEIDPSQFSNPEDYIKKSLDGMYNVFENPEQQRRKKLKGTDILRYAVLFLCIFGFFSAGAFVFAKIYDYYRSYVINSQLQELIEKEDFFQNEYLTKSSNSRKSLTPQDILNGKSEDAENQGGTFTKEQENLVGKIHQLKNINPDTAGWITISGTVVNYPVVWSETKNYYLRRDFYGKYLSGGTLFIDERNASNVAENKNTVIYGHNMKDGSMFASIHDFANASAFYSATIEIATEEGIFVYKPFSAHVADAYDNYFETDFVSDEDFIHFCEQMAFISIYETDYTFNKNSQILTLSTCSNDESAKDDRFAVHAILVQVIR